MSALNGLASTLTQNVASVQKEIVQVQTQLSSGKKTLNAAEVGIVTRLSAQVSGYETVSANVTQSLDLLAVTETALGSTTTILSQMKDIATQAANAGLTVSDRTALNATFSQLAVHVGNLLKGATVNNTNLLGSAAFIADGAVSTGDQSIQTGLTSSNFTTLASANLDTGAGLAANGFLNIATLSIGDQGLASSAIDVLTTALNTISNKQSIVSAEQTGLEELSKAAQSMATNLQSTVDSIQNVDETELQTRLQQLNNQQSIDYYLISQMNTAAAAILTIFR